MHFRWTIEKSIKINTLKEKVRKWFIQLMFYIVWKLSLRNSQNKREVDLRRTILLIDTPCKHINFYWYHFCVDQVVVTCFCTRIDIVCVCVSKITLLKIIAFMIIFETHRSWGKCLLKWKDPYHLRNLRNRDTFLV